MGTKAQASFEERIGRINSGTQWQPEGVIVEKRQVKATGPSALNPVSILFGIAFGMAAVLAARVVRFHLLPPDLSGGSANLKEALLIDAGFAGALILVMTLVGLGGTFLSFFGRMGGVTVAALCMHMTVHSYPEVFALAFSEAWVSDVITSTDPKLMLPVPSFGAYSAEVPQIRLLVAKRLWDRLRRATRGTGLMPTEDFNRRLQRISQDRDMVPASGPAVTGSEPATKGEREPGAYDAMMAILIGWLAMLASEMVELHLVLEGDARAFLDMEAVFYGTGALIAIVYVSFELFRVKGMISTVCVVAAILSYPFVIGFVSGLAPGLGDALYGEQYWFLLDYGSPGRSFFG